MVKKSAKTPAKKQRKLLHSRMQVFLSIVVVGVALIVGIIYAKAFFVQQQTLRDLDAAGKDLRVVYDNLLEANKGNVANSDFSKECSYAYVGPYSKSISCGPGAYLQLNNQVTIEFAKNATRNAISVLDKSQYRENITDKTYVIDYTDSNGTNCYLGYSIENKVGAHYWAGCRKTVPDFLPGYEVK